VVESHDDFPGVEISIAGGVGEMVRGLTTVTESLLIQTLHANNPNPGD